MSDRRQRQLAGMIAAGLMVISLSIGLTFVLGDWGGEIHEPGAFVEEGEIPGTILYVEYDSRFLDDEVNQTIARIDADGTNQQDLVQRGVPTADRAGFAWSPDGQWIAYTDPESASRDAPTVISLVSADGSETETIDMEPLEGVMRLNTILTWAHDGNHIALVHQDPERDQSQIAVVHRPTGSISHIMATDDMPGDHSHPAWMSGQLTLAFSESDSHGRHRILITDGTAPPETIVENESRAFQPEWSPDGGRIAWVGQSEGYIGGNLHVTDLSAGETQDITGHDERWDYQPTWSSRDLIAFMSNLPDGEPDIFVVNPDGSELRNLTEEIEWSANIPDWSDDGRYLTFTTVSPDQDRWRINVYEMDEDRLYTIHESENPLFYAQWRPEAVDDEQMEPDLPDDADIDVNEYSVEQLEAMRRGAELWLESDDSPIALTVNDEPIAQAEIGRNQANTEVRHIAMQEMLEDPEHHHPPMEMYNEAFLELIDEYGTENVGLGVALMNATIRVYAEENDLQATDEQVDELMKQQREMHEMLEQQDPEAAAAVGTALIDVIGEERYWDAYLPMVTEAILTERNVDEAAWEAADIEQDDPNEAMFQRDIFRAEFRADLIEQATIDVVDESALGDADLDRAIDYITEAYPVLQRERVEWQRELEEEHEGRTPEQVPGGHPPVPPRGLQTEDDVESYMQDLFAMSGHPNAEVLSISETTRGDVGTMAHTAPNFGDPDDPLWEVEARGYVPGPVPNSDTEPPDPENAATFIWLDPSTGIQPFFDAWDTSELDDNEVQSQ